jgi:hypothetical protein
LASPTDMLFAFGALPLSKVKKRTFEVDSVIGHNSSTPPVLASNDPRPLPIII